MRLSRQFQACFFYEKILRVQKHARGKNQPKKNENKLTLNNKGNDFSYSQKLLRG